MLNPCCEMIGCRNKVAYALTREGNGLLEEYLCASCFQAMADWYPGRAACYEPLPTTLQQVAPALPSGRKSGTRA